MFDHPKIGLLSDLSGIPTHEGLTLGFDMTSGRQVKK
jgi:hypothetical protein